MGKMLFDMILYLRKCPNQKIHETERAGFLVWALPEDIFFHPKNSEKPKISECAQVLVVTWVKLDFVKAPLSPGPT